MPVGELSNAVIKGRVGPERTGTYLLCSLARIKTVLDGIRRVGVSRFDSAGSGEKEDGGGLSGCTKASKCTQRESRLG